MRVSPFSLQFMALFASLLLVASCNKDASSASATPDPVKEEVEAQGLEYVCITAGKEPVGEPESRAGLAGDGSGVEWWIQDESGEWIPDPACYGDGADAGAAASECSLSEDGLTAFNGEDCSGEEAKNALLGASGDDLTPPYPQICASSESAPETKSYFSGNIIFWKANEKVMVYDDGYGDGHEFEVINGGGTATAKISGGVCQGCRTLYCVTPSSAGKGFKFDNNGTVTVTVPKAQAVTSGQNSCADAMVALAKISRTSSGALPGSATFKNVCSFIRFKFNDGDTYGDKVSSITVSSLDGEYLAGTVPVHWSGNNLAFGTVADDATRSTSITVTPPSTYFSKNQTYIIPVLAATSLKGVNYSYVKNGATYYGRVLFRNDYTLERTGGVDLGDVNGKGATAIEGFTTVTPASTTSMNFTWPNKSTSDAPLHYKIVWGSVNTPAASCPNYYIVTNPGTGATASVTVYSNTNQVLEAGTAYSFYIQTLDKNNVPVSGWSAATNKMTKIATPTVTVTGLTATTYRVSWTTPTGSDRYDVTASSVSGTPTLTNRTGTSVDITAASRNATGITVTVTAKNSSYSASSSAAGNGSGRCGYFSGGAGTSTSAPFIISSWADITDLMEWTQASTYKPVAYTNAGNTNLEFRASFYKIKDEVTSITGSTSTKTIGVNSSYPFSGNFNGNNKTITGYTINKTAESGAYVGLFGFVKNGTVQYLNCANFSLGASSTGNCQAPVVGEMNNGIVTYCTYSGSAITFKGAHVGGIVGYASNNSQITHCTVSSAIYGIKWNTGGICGSIYSGTEVSDCTVSATVTGGSTPNDGVYNTGGVVGFAQGSTISSCSMTGNVVGKQGGTAGNYTGGIVAWAQSSSLVSGCTMSGAVTGAGAHTGGIAGRLKASTCSNCTHSGNKTTRVVTGNGDNTGGIAGWVDTGGVVSECVNSTNVTCSSADSTERVAGIVGYLNASKIYGCRYSTGTVSQTGAGKGSVGGIAGYVLNSYPDSESSSELGVFNCIVFGDAYISNTTGKAGTAACAGKLRNSAIRNCYIGTRSTEETIFGYSLAASSTGVTVNSSGNCVGGFVGQAIYRTLVKDCYTGGGASYKPVKVYGNIAVGGIVGGFFVRNDGGENQKLTIRHCRFSASNEDNPSIVQGNTSSSYAIGGILGGLTDAYANSAKPYAVTIDIDHCFIQNNPQIITNNHSAGAIVGRYTTYAAGSYLNIYNCVVGSGIVKANYNKSNNRLGMLGSSLPHGQTAVINIINSAMYLSQYVTLTENPSAIGACIGYAQNSKINIKGLATSLGLSGTGYSKIVYNGSTNYSDNNDSYTVGTLLGEYASSATAEVNYVVCPTDAMQYWINYNTDTGIKKHNTTSKSTVVNVKNYSKAANNDNVAHMNAFISAYAEDGSGSTSGVGPPRSALKTWTYFNDPTTSGHAYIKW